MENHQREEPGLRGLTARLCTVALACLSLSIAGPALAQDDASGPSLSELTDVDIRVLDRMRTMIADLARLEIGTAPSGKKRDLELIQRLLDGRHVKPDDIWELNALGVVLGDVMVAELGLRWTIVDDAYGRTRALRYRETRNLVFPVSMITKRATKNIPVDVAALFEKIEREVAAYPPAR